MKARVCVGWKHAGLYLYQIKGSHIGSFIEVPIDRILLLTEFDVECYEMDLISFISNKEIEEYLLNYRGLDEII